MPPPPLVATFLDYFHLLWQQTVTKYILRHQALYLYYHYWQTWLSYSSTHTSHANKSKSSQGTIVSPEITDESQIPHGKCYSAILASCLQFKVKLIECDFKISSTRDADSVINSRFTILTNRVNNTWWGPLHLTKYWLRHLHSNTTYQVTLTLGCMG